MGFSESCLLAMPLAGRCSLELLLAAMRMAAL
jgi:hypothetical protein